MYHFPGSEWLYLKIYCSPYTSSLLLKDYLFPFISKLKEKPLSFQYFFIRYADPKYHVRIRFKMKDDKDYFFVFKSLNELFIRINKDLSITSIVIDTYTPELIRYKSNNLLAICEQIFYLDSEACRRIFHCEQYNNIDNFDVVVAFYSIEEYFNSLNIDLRERSELMFLLHKNRNVIYSNNKELKLSIDKVCRRYSDIVRSLESNPLIQNFDIKQIFEERSREICSYLNEENKLHVKQFALDFIHLNLNRMFNFEMNKYELIISQLMGNYYSYKLNRR